MKLSVTLFFLFSILFISPFYQFSEKTNINNPELFSDLTYRNLGPFRAGAWISDIAVPENPKKVDRYTFYVAARNGGVWKTINNGTTFFPIFDDYGVNSIGSVEVAPSDSSIVWVGTGDDSNARSAYYGNGIYKSIDGGKTFYRKGLKDSHHIGKIIIHPSNPDIVYAAVMGHLFSLNEERGVFKTIDGGNNWEKVLYINDRTGVADIVMDPDDPEILFAATYDKQRYPWHFEAGGEESRIYRSVDSGKNWKELLSGLPSGKLGRIGIDICRSHPNTLYAVIQNLNPKPDLKKDKKIKFDPFTDHSYDELIGGEVYRSDNRGETWRKVSLPGIDVSGKAAYSFNEISVDPKDPEKVYIIAVQMLYSKDGGKTWPGWKNWRERELFKSNFGDVRTFWIDPDDPEHMMLGSDGGLYSSWDGGKTTFHYYNIPLGEIYDIETDNSEPYNIYAGLQDHETWKAPVNGWSGSVGIEDWVITGMWDGMYTSVDPKDNRWLYFTTQFGKHHRVDQERGERTEITPENIKGKAPYRYTWTTPIVLSPHDSKIVYTGGQMVLRSMNRGISWEEISPDLTLNDPEKIAGKGHIMYCTITTISESPLRKGMIWAGTDDGKIHVTDNNGLAWKDRTPNLARSGAPSDKWVSRIVPSSHKAYRAYLTKSGYREDDFKAYIYRTDNMGRTWHDISGDIPDSPVSIIVEDKRNKLLLFAGTDTGVFFTINGGKNWIRLKNNMPPVPIRDIVVHEKTSDLIAGTYGRGIWVTNISPLQELSEKILRKKTFLFDIIPGYVMTASQRSWWGNFHMTGDNHLRTENEKPGLKVFYYTGKDQVNAPELQIFDNEGKQLQKIQLSKTRGIHKIIWNSPGRKPGIFKFILISGKKKILKTGELKPAILWPLKKS